MGGFSSTANFDALSLTSNGDYDVFLAKYDALGNIVWAKKAGSPQRDIAKNVNNDKLGNIYVTGTFSSTFDLGTTTLSSNNSSVDIFIAKYDPAGMLLWAQKAGGTNLDVVMDCTIDNNNNLLLSGAIFGPSTVTFGGTTVSVTSNSDFFVAKYLPNGSLVWVRTGLSNAFSSAYAIATDQDNNVYVGGFFKQNLTINGDLLSTNGQDNAFFIKYSSFGNVVWWKQFDGNGTNDIRNIVVDNNRQIYISGKFTKTLQIGENSMTSKENLYGDLFVAKFNQDNSDWEYATRYGGISVEEIEDLAIDYYNDLYGTGYFFGSLTFGSTKLNSNSSASMFLCRIE